LLDNNGEFIIFAHSNDEHLQTEDSTKNGTSKTLENSAPKEVEQPNLEENFNKLNYTNKI